MSQRVVGLNRQTHSKVISVETSPKHHFDEGPLDTMLMAIGSEH